MSGWIRVDQWTPTNQDRVNEDVDEKRTIVALAHVLDLSMSSGTMDLGSIGRHEARRDFNAGSGTIGRFQTFSAEVLHALTQTLRGNAELVQNGGGDNVFTYLQPFAVPPFGVNGLHLQSISELSYIIDWFTNNTDWSNTSSDEHRVYAMVADDVPEAYLLRSEQQDLDFSGAQDQERNTFHNNVSHLVIVDDGSLGSLEVVRDGKTIVDDIPANDLSRLTDTVHSVDSPSQSDLYVIDVLQGDSPAAALADTVRVEGTASGAGDVDVYAVSLDFENSRAEVSFSQTFGNLRTRLQRTDQELPQVLNALGSGIPPEVLAERI